MLSDAQYNRILDPEVRNVVQTLANLFEQSLTDMDALKVENHQLKDQLNRLLGEQGKPKIKPNKPADKDNNENKDNNDHSSEKQRRVKKPWSKDTKNDKIVIDQTLRIPMDTDTLPSDALFKGFETTLLQNLVLKTENVCFERAKYYSPSTGKTYIAPLPPGYEGGFGPDLKALVLSLHHLGNVSQPALHTLLTHSGILISTGQVSNLLVEGQEVFHKEKKEIGLAGLASSKWHQTDDTSTRVYGINQHCHVLGNPLYVLYTTLPQKDRLSVLAVLQNGEPRGFLLTPKVRESAAVGKLSKKQQEQLASFLPGTVFGESALLAMFAEFLPTVSCTKRKGVMEAMALAAYQAQTTVPVISLLVCDDAPQFPGLTSDLALCWIHDARHYQKLLPHLPCFGERLDLFKTAYWKYYARLLAYRESPTPEVALKLWEDFDTLFDPKTDYGALDYRIQQTRKNKEKLLQVLWHPEIPLHNNASELAVRRRVRKRDVSFGPRSALGVAAWDTFQTLAGTCQKLGVSFMAYVADRVSHRYALPSLASLITERAVGLNLDGSWA